MTGRSPSSVEPSGRAHSSFRSVRSNADIGVANRALETLPIDPLTTATTSGRKRGAREGWVEGGHRDDLRVLSLGGVNWPV